MEYSEEEASESKSEESEQNNQSDEEYAPEQANEENESEPESSDDSDSDGEDDSYHEYNDSVGEDDEEVARRLDREMNGLRGRPRRTQFVNIGHAEASVSRPKRGVKRRVEKLIESESEDDQYIPVHNRSTRSNAFKIAKKNYRDVSEDEDDYEDDEYYKAAAKQKAKEQNVPKVCALLNAHQALDDTEYDIERVIRHKTEDESRVFQIKWQRRAYLYSTWESEEDLQLLNGYKRVTNYVKKLEDLEARKAYMTLEEIEQVNIEKEMELELVSQHMQLERIVEEQSYHDIGVTYLLKWEGLPYSECTWDTPDIIDKCSAHDVLDRYQQTQQRCMELGGSIEAQRKMLLQDLRQKGGRLFTSQPTYIQGGTLRGYQLDGLNYLAACWARNSNCILADEMGLGKTIQCVSMLNFLYQGLDLMGPYLVVVPLSTVPNWKKELKIWAPDLNTIVYVGDGVSREVMRKYEVYNKTKGRKYKMNVLLTTYEVVLKDSSFLKSIQWTYLMVDEAHRLKNNESALYRELSSFHCKTKLLVTGTPLQNNVKELWALLHFLHPKDFSSCEEFEESHDMNDEDGLKRLHEDLMPHLLRRTIKDVEKSLPPKTERILRVSMSPLQKKYYKLILKRNFNELNKGVKGSGHVSLLNIVVELKKCCNHPFLFESAEEAHYHAQIGNSRMLALILASGKLTLLDKLLLRLKDTGHRVLIFSQMVRMLSILADYCRLKGFKYQQLDGSTNAQSRHQAMEHFNAPGSEDFIFLLSTRAGGLGINLATADTVVIFDSDWNPQNDLQAMSRAHRIGQKDTVNIYRFLTANSVEEDILERAKRKMVLDQLVIQQMDTSGRTVLNASTKSAKKIFNKDDLAAILKFGAEDLFKEEEDQANADGVEGNAESNEVKDDLDAILARAEHVQEQEKTGAEDFLSSFKVADIKTADEEEKTFWERLIPEQERPKTAEEEVDIYVPRAARMAAPKSYAEQNIAKNAYNVEEKRKTRKQKPTKIKIKIKSPSNGKVRIVKNALHRVDEWKEGPAEFGQAEAKAFLQVARQVHDGSKIIELMSEASPMFAQVAKDAVMHLHDLLVQGCVAVTEIQQKSREEERAKQAKEESQPAKTEKEREKDGILDFFGNSVKANDTYNRLLELKVVQSLVGKLDNVQNFRIESGTLPRAPTWGRMCGWNPKDDAMLVVGIYKYGLGAWDKVLSDSSFGLAERMSRLEAQNANSLKNTPVGCLQNRAYALLRRLREVETGYRYRDGQKAVGPIRKKASVVSNKAVNSGMQVKDLMLDIKSLLKKIKSLQSNKKKYSNQEKLERILSYLSKVGKYIEDLVRRKRFGKSQEQALWQYASKVAHTNYDGIKMQAIYERMRNERNSEKKK